MKYIIIRLTFATISFTDSTISIFCGSLFAQKFWECGGDPFKLLNILKLLHKVSSMGGFKGFAVFNAPNADAPFALSHKLSIYFRVMFFA